MLVLFVLVAILVLPLGWFVFSHFLDGIVEIKIRKKHLEMLSKLKSKEFIDGNAYIIKTYGESKSKIELMPLEAFDLINGKFELVVVEPKNRGSPSK